MTLPLTAQIQCVERELALRQRVYAHRVRHSEMKQEQADKEIALMTAVLKTLNDCAARGNTLAITGLVGEREAALDRGAALEYLTEVIGGLAGLAAAALGVERAHALLDRCKLAATEAAADFKARAN